MIRALLEQKRIVVCVGPGGVGKTTTSAAIGALAAREGRRTLICTIDPAPRLADALGQDRLAS
jgi:anion-transporting  ArsA/GET3 family ATPase